jgi:predicted O-methyltransferase YrrM
MTAELDLGSGWRLGESAYRAILDDLRANDARCIVEFGSGVSTIHLSRDLPNAEILSIEGDLQYCEQTRRDLDRLGGPANVRLVHRPIVWQRLGFGLFRSYAPGPFPREVDAVLIDGPPLATRRGREACLYQVFPSCRPGTRIYLDDFCREAERRIVANWLRAYPDALSHVTTFEVDHRVAVLERVGREAKRHAHWKNGLDSLTQSIKQLVGR